MRNGLPTKWLVAALVLTTAGILGVVVVRQADFPTQAAAAAPQIRAAPVTKETVPPADTTRVIGDRLAVNQRLAERWVPPAKGTATMERWRLARIEVDPSRPFRIVDRLERDPATGMWRLTGQEIMRPDSIIVGVPGDSTAAVLHTRLKALGFATEPGSVADSIVTIALPEATLDAVPEALARLAIEMPEVRAEPNYILFPLRVTPSEYDAEALWGLESIEAPGAWAFHTGSQNVVVAVIDTGIDRTHPDLVPNLFTNTAEIPGNGIDDDGNGFVDDINGWNFAEGGNAQSDDTDDHGTHVAGTIGARGNNGTGVVGVNWQVRILPVRAGGRTFDNAASINALRYVTALKLRGVNIVAVNASFGGSSFSSLFRDEIIAARNAGVLFIAAAGNDGANNDALAVYPAGYDVDNVIAVASLHQGGALSDFSNYGRITVDLAAPGSGVRSAVRDGKYAYFDGTSMATPHVVGAAALIAANEPGITAAQIKQRLMQTVDPLPSLATRVASGGRLNVRRALAPASIAPRVAITTPAAKLVAMQNPGMPLALHAMVGGEGGVVPAATLAWEIVSGPAGASVVPATSTSATASFPQAGLYQLRVRANSGVLTETDAITVLIGNPAASIAGLSAWWTFDEAGGAALDGSGANRTGTLNATTRAPGVLGTAALFDGLTSNVGFTAPTLPRLSYAGWVRADAAGNSIFPRVIHMRSGLLFFGLQATTPATDGNNATLKFALDDGLEGRVWYSRPGSISVGPWIHVAVTYDGTVANPTPRLYVNGRPLITVVQSGAAAGTPTVAAGSGFIGDRGDGTRVWKGAIDDLRVYDRELTAAEVFVLGRETVVRSLLNGTVTTTPTVQPLVANMMFAPTASSGPSEPITAIAWSASGPGSATIDGVGGTSARLTVTAPGSYIVRQDVTTSGGVQVVRTTTVELPLPVVTTPGYYSGSTSGGGVFAFIVDDAGSGTYLGSGAQGLFGASVGVTSSGAFAFVTRSGVSVSGLIDATGTLSGTHSDGTGFSGMRLAGPSSGPDAARDGVYRGWMVDSGTRVHGLVTGGRIALTVEQAGAATAFASGYETAGAFSATVSASSFNGSVGNGVIDGTLTLSGGSARRFVLLREGTVSDGRLVNLAVRGRAGQGDASLIAGFVVGSGTPRAVLVRGVGPALNAFGVSGALPDPRLILRSGGNVIVENAGWDAAGDASAVAAAAVSTGAFALGPGARDSAVLVALNPGLFTAQVSGDGGGSGVALAEVYEVGGGTGGTRLLNLSSRASVGIGDSVLIGGFVVSGTQPALVLVRGIGPGLAVFGVPGVLNKPELTVLRGAAPIAVGLGWSLGADAGLVAEAATRVGAFPLVEGGSDAALLLLLPPGPYTVQLRAQDGATGIGLVEIYEVSGF